MRASESIWGHLRESESMWEDLRAHESIWQHLRGSESIWENLMAFDIIGEHLRTFETIREHVGKSSNLKRASRSLLRQVLKKWFWQGLEASLREMNIEIFNFCSWSNEISTFSPRPPFGGVYLRCFFESGKHWNTTVIIRFFDGLGVPRGCLF